MIVVVVGGGWAGYTAAESLSASADVDVTVLEASPRAAGGLAGGLPLKRSAHSELALCIDSTMRL